MTVDVLRLQGDYIIQTQSNQVGISSGGNITLDVGSSNGVNTGTVFINGNLIVYGNQTSLNTIDASIKDRTITLNSGDPNISANGGITGSNGNQTSGLKIARGKGINVNGQLVGQDQDQYAAFFEWNDANHWQGTGAISTIQGLWEFRVGRSGRPQYSGIKINAIRIDENSASTSGAGAGQGTRLNIFGSDNPTSVISVSGTANYESRVTDKDDIPNKAYVDLAVTSVQQVTSKIVLGNSYVTLHDFYNDGVTSEVIAVLDGNPTERLTITTGTIAMRLTPSVAQFQDIQFSSNEIDSVGPNQDLKLTANGTGQVIINRPLMLTTGHTPVPAVGQTGLYVHAPGSGGTGVFFQAKDLNGTVRQDEFMGRKRALVYSIIFG